MLKTKASADWSSASTVGWLVTINSGSLVGTSTGGGLIGVCTVLLALWGVIVIEDKVRLLT